MLTNKEAMDFILKIEEPFKSLPHLPKGVVEFIVKITPYLALLGAILGLVAVFPLLMAGGAVSILSLSGTLLVWTLVTVVVTLANSVIMFMAYTPLKNKEMKGWMLLFWSEVISVVSSLFGLFAGQTNIVGTLIGVVIGLYILFEMKPFYMGTVEGEIISKLKK